ncbi:hypothetical protein ACFWZT_13585 [Streptomyces alboflavus]
MSSYRGAIPSWWDMDVCRIWGLLVPSVGGVVTGLLQQAGRGAGN